MTQPSSQQRLLVRVAIVTAITLLLHVLGLLRPIERPLVAGLSAIGSRIDRTFHLSRRTDETSSTDERQRINQLEDRLAMLSVENVELRSTLEALRASTEQQAFLTERKLRGVSGRIFARSADPTSEYFVVNIGAKHGVTVGAPAIIEGGIIVGRVITLSDESARILLTTDNRSSYEAVVATSLSAKGVVSGVRGLSLQMTLIPQDESLTVGQLVVTPGTDRDVPSGLLLGAIDRVDRQQGALFQSASLRPLYNALRLDTVTVLTNQVP